MRGFELLEKMGLIDPQYIEEADKTPTRRVNIWLKLGAVAACIAILIAVFFNLPRQEIPQLDPTQPTGTHTNNHGGAGGGGYSAYDISQVTNNNPWYETAELEFLPIYDNPLSSNGAGEAWGADIADLKAFALDVAARLGIESPAMEYRSYRGKPVPEDSTGPTKVIIEADGVSVEVDQMMTARIDFEPAISLPKEYKPSYNMSYDEAFAIAEYLKIEYCDLIGMNDPQISIEGHYNFSGQPNYQIYFYNGSDDLTEEIINYNFRSIKFWCSEDGLSTVIIEDTDLSHKTADLPVISVSDAEALLTSGQFSTDSGDPFPGKEYIRKVELVYQNSVFDDYFIPCYRFYVEIPNIELTEQSDQNIKIYSTYYVLAVDTSYTDIL